MAKAAEVKFDKAEVARLMNLTGRANHQKKQNSKAYGNKTKSSSSEKEVMKVTESADVVIEVTMDKKLATVIWHELTNYSESSTYESLFTKCATEDFVQGDCVASSAATRKGSSTEINAAGVEGDSRKKMVAEAVKGDKALAEKFEEKEVVEDKAKEVEVVAPEVKGVDVVAPEVKGVDVVAPEAKGVDVVAPEAKGVDVVAPEAKGVDVVAPEAKGVNVVAPEVKRVDVVADEAKEEEVEVEDEADQDLLLDVKMVLRLASRLKKRDKLGSFPTTKDKKDGSKGSGSVAMDELSEDLIFHYNTAFTTEIQNLDLNSYEQEMDRFPESYQALKMLELVLERDRVSETVIDIWKCRLDAVSHTKLDVVELDNENAGRNQKLYHVTSTMVDFCHNGPPEMLLSEGVCSEPSLDYVKANFKKLANSFRDAYLKELYCEIDYGLHGPYFAISRWMKLYAQFSHPDPHVKFSINYELPQLSSKRSTPQQVSSGDQSLPMWRYFQQSRVLPLKPSFLNYSFENFGSLKPLVKMNSETEHTLKLEYLACVNKMEEKGICLNQIYCAPLISEFFPRSS
ncbi:hypothetical protein EB796_015776 [Bugula neritina]|uniref:Uncharacterized protein n=1 Tax=Bugula neritina TaxID=10212 RepID=A0A7J7JJC2_BUGNE|nr:hypothetical protein EB796_015776 [Bugula neritina]